MSYNRYSPEPILGMDIFSCLFKGLFLLFIVAACVAFA